MGMLQIKFQIIPKVLLFITAAFSLLFSLQYYQLAAVCKEHMNHLSLSNAKCILAFLLILLIKAETINITPTTTSNPSINTTPSIVPTQPQERSSIQTTNPLANGTNPSTNIAQSQPTNSTANMAEVYENYGNITLLQLTSTNSDTNGTKRDTQNHSQPQSLSTNQISNTYVVQGSLGEGNNYMMGDQQLSYLVNQLTKLQGQSSNQGTDAISFQNANNLSQQPTNLSIGSSSSNPPQPSPKSPANVSISSNDFILDAMKTKVDSRFLDLFRD